MRQAVGLSRSANGKNLRVHSTRHHFTPDTSNGWMLALVGLLVLLLCIALAVIGWMAFLR